MRRRARLPFHQIDHSLLEAKTIKVLRQIPRGLLLEPVVVELAKEANKQMEAQVEWRMNKKTLVNPHIKNPE